MHLVILGLNHKTAPVEVRERFSLSRENIIKGLKNLSLYQTLDEAVVLSTCNRSEIYAVVDEKNANIRQLKQFWFDLSGSNEEIDEYLYSFYDEECIRHLFRVASSLDSLIIGEGQILSQVKEAYSVAREENATSTILNTLFHRAIATGKRVRTETRIAFNAVSVSYAAVELAKKVFGTLSESNVLIYGAGKMAELAAQNLLGAGARKIYVANRHRDKAQELACRFKGTAVSFNDAFTEAGNTDVVITSTGAPHYVIRPWAVQQVMARRAGRPLIFIDIAVPRDVDPLVENIKGVTLYNIDDLEAVVDEHKEARGKEAKLAEAIIEEELDSILDKFQYLSCQPLMALLSRRAEMIRARELRRIQSKLPAGLDEDSHRLIEHMTKMIVRKLLREPMKEINASAGTEKENFYIKAMTKLFKLDMVGTAANFEQRHRAVSSGRKEA